MESSVLTALASYCNNPKTSWASSDDAANKIARNLFQSWAASNNWTKPWDGFIPICKENGINAAAVTKHYEREQVLAIFPWYGSTWALISE